MGHLPTPDQGSSDLAVPISEHSSLLFVDGSFDLVGLVEKLGMGHKPWDPLLFISKFMDVHPLENGINVYMYIFIDVPP